MDSIALHCAYIYIYIFIAYTQIYFVFNFVFIYTIVVIVSHKSQVSEYAVDDSETTKSAVLGFVLSKFDGKAKESTTYTYLIESIRKSGVEAKENLVVNHAITFVAHALQGSGLFDECLDGRQELGAPAQSHFIACASVGAENGIDPLQRSYVLPVRVLDKAARAT